MATIVTGETLAAFNESKMADPFQQAEVEAEKAETKAAEIKAEEDKTKAKADPEPEVVEDEIEDKPKDEKPKKGKLAERFSEITQARNAEKAAREAAEARANKLAAELDELKKPAEKAAAVDAGKPKLSDFTDAIDYAEALAAWTVKDAFAKRDAQEAQAKVDAKRTEVLKGWEERLEAAKERHPDFEEMMLSSKLEVTNKIRDKIVESPYGPDILYFLASDDEAAAALKAMDEDESLQYLGELRASFKAAAKEAEKTEVIEEKPKAEKPKPKLPSPITPIKAKSTSNDPVNDPGEFTGTYAEWKAQRAKQRA